MSFHSVYCFISEEIAIEQVCTDVHAHVDREMHKEILIYGLL